MGAPGQPDLHAVCRRVDAVRTGKAGRSTPENAHGMLRFHLDCGGCVPEIRRYDIGRERLDDLLAAASDPEGATLLVPDLQRPYVWMPRDVIALVDSLLRGWPFGTLLLWKIGKLRDGNEERLLPARPFWQRVDRTLGGEGTREMGRAGKGAQFRMVLDGQQRLQSLLLATRGDDAGFRLTDFEWRENAGERPAAHHREYWSAGQLCLDTDAFLRALDGPQSSVMRIDYREVLRWVDYGAEKGGSAELPRGYVRPVENFVPGRHIRFSQLWRLARDQWVSEALYKERLDTHLPGWEVPIEKRPMLRDRLAELLTVIGGLKDTEVSYLAIRAPDLAGGEKEQEEYDDAVVSIFTRLNTGGMRLTDQEVLFAWIKRKWNAGNTGHRGADRCFEDLQSALEDGGITLELDELVRGVSVIWSAIAKDGVLIDEKQFRRGVELGAVAPWMAERWSRIEAEVLATARLLDELGLEQARHFESLNSVYVLWAWRFLAAEWADRHVDRNLAREALARAVEEHCRKLGARWMLVPQWAGRWQDARSFRGYVEDLGKLWRELEGIADWEAAVARWAGKMDGWIAEARDDAAKFVTDVHAERRNTVRRYHGLLWAWQRLDPDRRRLSAINLTMISQQQAIGTDVDHVVSYSQWTEEFGPVLAAAGETIDGIVDGANALGNCLLLAKNFNITKKDRPLKDLLAQVWEFKGRPQLVADFCRALHLDERLLDATNRPVKDVRDAVAARSQQIRAELLEYIRGERDLQELAGGAVTTMSPWQGTWAFETADERNGDTEAGTLALRQEGRVLSGTYGEGKTIEAVVDGDYVNGTWRESDDTGRFEWNLSEDGLAFSGRWGRGNRRRDRGSWNGRKHETPA